MTDYRDGRPAVRVADPTRDSRSRRGHGQNRLLTAWQREAVPTRPCPIDSVGPVALHPRVPVSPVTTPVAFSGSSLPDLRNCLPPRSIRPRVSES